MNDDVAVLLAQLEMEYMPGSNTLSLRKKAASTIRALVAENERTQKELQATALEALTAQGQAWDNYEHCKEARAKLCEAVEVMYRISLKSQDNSTTKEAVGREAFLFLATMEKPSDP